MRCVLYSVFIIGLIFAASLCEAAQPQKTFVVTIPDINIVKDAAGLFDLNIPNGKKLLEEAMPEIPYYITKVIYPKGYKIIKVNLVDQTDEQVFPKMDLPIVGNEKTPKEKSGTYPKKYYDWADVKNPDGSVTLELEIYPFVYDLAEHTSKMYKTFKFDVDYSASLIEISKATPSKPKYYPKDKVKVAVDIDNPGTPQDVNVNVSLISKETNKQVADFTDPNPVKLDNNKKKSVTVEGPIDNVPAGDYKLVVTILDPEDKPIDAEVSYITIYYPKIELTGLEITPKKFKLGDKINFNLNAKNTGNVDIDAAKAIFQVMLEKDIVEEMAEIFPATKAGAAVTVSSSWNSSVAKTGSMYHVKAYVLFDQWQSNEIDEVFSTNAMPIPKFTYMPNDPKVGTEIKFDASASMDEDGKITQYKWDFGDNSEVPSISQLIHKYSTYGVFNVVLTVTDNEGGTATYSKIITIKKPQTQMQQTQPE